MGSWFLLYVQNTKRNFQDFSAATNVFINGSDNYRTSALKDHNTSKTHKQACVENEIQKGKERVEKCAPKPMKITIPKSSPSCKVSIE